MVLKRDLVVPRGFEALLERRRGASVLFGGSWMSGRFVPLA
jgi:hypothetical protein